LAGAAILPAQDLKFGVKAGFPFTDSLDTEPTATIRYDGLDKRFGIGPTVEYWYNRRIGVALDLLYRRIGFDSIRAVGTPQVQLVTSKTRGNSWEIPIQAKTHFWDNKWNNLRPFVGAGLSFRFFTGVEEERQQFVDGLPATIIVKDPPILENSWTPGFVFGGGVEVGEERFQFRPELRYTIWGRNQFQAPLGDLESTQNQFELLISFVF
jgi:hypothetical protein